MDLMSITGRTVNTQVGRRKRALMTSSDKERVESNEKQPDLEESSAIPQVWADALPGWVDTRHDSILYIAPPL